MDFQEHVEYQGKWWDIHVYLQWHICSGRYIHSSMHVTNMQCGWHPSALHLLLLQGREGPQGEMGRSGLTGRTGKPVR